MISDELKKKYDREYLVWGAFGSELLGARPFAISKESFEKLWELHSVHESLTSDIVEHTPERFAAYLLTYAKIPTEVVTLPDEKHVGFMYLTDLVYDENQPGQAISAFGHFSFWDGKIGPRRLLIQEVISVITGALKMHRLSVRLPEYAVGAIAAAVRLGFRGEYDYMLRDRKIKVEGVLRGAIKYKGEWNDVVILSKVGSELNGGD